MGTWIQASVSESWETVLTAAVIALTVLLVFTLLDRLRSSKRRKAAWDAYAEQQIAHDPGPRGWWPIPDSESSRHAWVRGRRTRNGS